MNASVLFHLSSCRFSPLTHPSVVKSQVVQVISQYPIRPQNACPCLKTPGVKNPDRWIKTSPLHHPVLCPLNIPWHAERVLVV